MTRTGSGVVPSEGKKVTLTLVGSMVGAGASAEEGRSGTEPVAAKIRPQLVGEKKRERERKGRRGALVLVNESQKRVTHTLHLLHKVLF